MLQKYFLKRRGSDWFKKSIAFGLTMTLNFGMFSNCANAMEKVPSTTRILEKSLIAQTPVKKN